MTYERLIIAVDTEAPQLTDIAYKLLWRLIALAIHRGTPEVDTSFRALSNGLSLSKEGVARASRELGRFIKITSVDGQGTTYALPPDWFPPQRTLFADERLGGNLDERPGSQDASVLFARTLASHQPGHQRPISQDASISETSKRPGSQDTSVPFPRTLRPNPQDAAHDGTGEDTCARVDRSIDSILAPQDAIGRVDRAVQTVEILPSQRESADVLRGALIDYRDAFPVKPRMSDIPDDVVVAHILAIADVEHLCRVLRTLQEAGRAPGASDMWFFFTLCQKVLGASNKLVHDRMDRVKAKARPFNQKPGLFEAQLLEEVQGKLRRIG